MYTTQQCIEYFNNKPHLNAEFKNLKDRNIEIFMLVNGTIGIGEIGNGLVYEFNRNDYIDDLWIMSLNPFRKSKF